MDAEREGERENEIEREIHLEATEFEKKREKREPLRDEEDGLPVVHLFPVFVSSPGLSQHTTVKEAHREDKKEGEKKGGEKKGKQDVERGVDSRPSITSNTEEAIVRERVKEMSYRIQTFITSFVLL